MATIDISRRTALQRMERGTNELGNWIKNMETNGHTASDIRRRPDCITKLKTMDSNKNNTGGQPPQEGGWKPTSVVIGSRAIDTHKGAIMQDVMLLLQDIPDDSTEHCRTPYSPRPRMYWRIFKTRVRRPT